TGGGTSGGIFIAGPSSNPMLVMTCGVELRQAMLDRYRRLARPRPQPHQACIDYDAVQPSGQAAVTVEAVDASEGADERLLHGICSFLLTGKEPAGGGEHAAAEVAHERLERAFLTILKPAH